ncbi:GGDEF domain-containing protein [Candidatus Macondimonas diazotrophica]|uniref:diguanylate cyclase n=1 Tax=Candidatus Macondimonas diazotrophica TaxID=2305248 RepID=A0A4Z0FCD1_9GAMM|nr:diguanylate cyclase [Candidatus Macondimonas diazotrophica]NCU01451.1 GGDEF domain-containing protein [Candidatus Macondimonas diazotrophica]TFZ83597.1 GGDEF domain-containing protein [Candidatus Macondimonas diazotrophica]
MSETEQGRNDRARMGMDEVTEPALPGGDLGKNEAILTRHRREAMRGIPLAVITWALFFVLVFLARRYRLLNLSQEAQDVFMSLAIAWTIAQYVYFRTSLCQRMMWSFGSADRGFVLGHGLLALGFVWWDGFSLFGVMLMTLLVPTTTAFLGLGAGFGSTLFVGAIVQAIVWVTYQLAPGEGKVDGLLFALFWCAWLVSWLIGAITNGNAQSKKRLIAAMLRAQRDNHGLIERQTRELDEKSRALELANGRLSRLSMVDGLTEVANRRRFDEALHEEWRRARRAQLADQSAPAPVPYDAMALLLLDIDYFKQYNDHYGHLAGDACLKQVAATIACAIRRSGDLVARYGGEEFAIILPATPLAGGFSVAERIRRMIWDAAIPHAESPLGRVTVSIGVADVQGQDCGGETDLLRMADGALYAAKRAGRNRVAQAVFEVSAPTGA